MTATTASSLLQDSEPGWGETVASLLVGAAVTATFFFGLAHFEYGAASTPPPQIEDLRVVSAPLDVPPPLPVDPVAPAPVEAVNLGFEPSPSESPVKIQATPPDLVALLPPPPLAPHAALPTDLYLNLKPRGELADGGQRIFQVSEVDQKPAVIFRVIPHIPASVRHNADSLSVTLLLLIDADGAIKSVRMAQTSGNPAFDELMSQGIHDWAFSPAIRRGVKVRCLLLQAVTFHWSSGSPFLL